MNKLFLPILLLINLVGRGQKTIPGTTLLTIDPPRTATAWASLQNEVDELKKEVSYLNGEIALHEFMIYGINGMGHKTWTGLVEDNENLKKQVDIITELADSLRRISGHYHDALYGSDLFGKGLLIEEFNDYVDIHFLEKKVDSLIKAIRANPLNGMKLSKPDTLWLRNFKTEDTVFDYHNGGLQTTQIEEGVLISTRPWTEYDINNPTLYRTNIADPAAAKVVHFNNGCDLGTVRHGKGWARKHKVKGEK